MHMTMVTSNKYHDDYNTNGSDGNQIGGSNDDDSNNDLNMVI